MKEKPIDLRGTLYVTDWLKDVKYAPHEVEIVQVLFKNTRSGFYQNPDNLPLKKGDWVAVEASPGHDIGQVMLTGPLVRLQMKKANAPFEPEGLKRIFRKATVNDLERFHEAREREHSTMIRSRQIAAELGLDMKIGDVEYQGDGLKAIFYYIADERVDFRKLIRILADTFKIKIEMKQIGARQEAGRIGGIGPCGRPLCCSTWLSRFNSVGTGAARVQDLSMNPLKLAGQCAKLKCCLNFETDVYAEAAKALPPKDISLFTKDNEYFHFKTDILSGNITYSTDKRLGVNLVTIPKERVFEIIDLNKRGEKPDELLEKVQTPEPRQEYVEIVGQDSLTRFDKSKSGKRGNQKTEGKNAQKGNAGKGNQKPASRNQKHGEPTQQNRKPASNNERKQGNSSQSERKQGANIPPERKPGENASKERQRRNKPRPPRDGNHKES